jgi:hypothetical protein
MSKEELEEYLDTQSQELIVKIESGEIDIWDDTPQYTSIEEAKRFLQDSTNTLSKKFLKACAPDKSLLEHITKTTTDLLSKEPKNKKEENEILGRLMTYKALLVLWDSARMFHEGEPPYKISFSNQVSEKLGLDPILASAKLSEMRPLRKGSYQEKLVTAALSICNKNNDHLKEIPNRKEVLRLLVDTIEIA